MNKATNMTGQPVKPLTMRLTGETRLYAILGDPIAQVKSPTSLSAILASRGRDAMVLPMHVAPEAIDQVFPTLWNIRNLDGLLATVPHKQAALANCIEASERARFVGAVNVMRRGSEGWFGDNTDGCGYVDGLQATGFEVAGKSALLIGCGGAGSAIALELLDRGVSRLALHDVDETRRESLRARLERRFPGRVGVGDRDPRGFDLIANATPMGMNPSDPLPVDGDRLEAGQFVACAITKPAVSPIIQVARARGCGTMTGAGMFDAQAERLVDFLLGGSREDA